MGRVTAGVTDRRRPSRSVAARVGFVSTDGYILAFRRHFGQTPGAYVRSSLDRSA
ncbi:hypothetical protein [Streptomyces nojiriensis]|uniref:hypothetical protein n=1 Tax=Streptomyces nojiriensis TaxID=66374 RepID=UPI0035DA86DF